MNGNTWLDELKRQYALDLPRKLEEIRGLAADGAARRPELLLALHKLGGSAGSFDLGEVSIAAQAWERRLRADATAAAEAADLASLEAAVQAGLARLLTLLADSARRPDEPG